MANEKRWRACAVAMVLAWAWACGGSPNGPTLNVAHTVLRITGPASFAPGTTARYQATLHHSDGSSEDITQQATWTSGSDVVQMSHGGVAFGNAGGETTVVARYQQLADVWPVLILEPGTYKLAGRVVESGSPFLQGIAGATAEVVNGTGVGLRATTANLSGDYALYGVAGDVRVEVAAPGYRTRVLQLNVSENTFDRVIDLTPAEGPPGSLSGRWTLALQAPECSGLPQDARLRQYRADILQTASRLEIKLSKESLSRSAALIGQVDGEEMSFQIPYTVDFIDGPEYAVFDTLQQGTVGIRGLIYVLLDDGTAKGTFDGTFDYYPGGRSPVLQCPGRGSVSLWRQGP